MVFSDGDLPECFRAESNNDLCVISVPLDYHAAELIISAENIWEGTAKVVLPAADDIVLNTPPRNAESLLFEGIFAQWIAVLLGLSLILLIGLVAYRKYKDQ